MGFDLSRLANTPTDKEEILNYLREGIPALIEAIGELDNVFDKADVEPSRPQEGTLRYADGTNWNPGSGAGMYRYTSGAWVLIMGSGGAGIYAPLASPVFTGNPTGPTPTVGDNDTSLATTAFVNTIFATPPTLGNTTPAAVNGTTGKLNAAVPSTLVAGTRYTGFGALHLITSTTIAVGGVDSVNFTGVLTGAFNHYKLIANIAPETDSVELFLRFGSGGSYASGASDYRWAFWAAIDSGASGIGNDAADSEISLRNALGATAGEHVSATIHIFGPASTTLHKRATWLLGEGDTAAAENAVYGSGRYLSTSAVTDVQLLFSSGQIAAGGTVELYGLAPL